VKTASPTDTSGAANLGLVSGIGLVDVSRPEVGERLAGQVSDQLEQFATQMSHGLLAASVTIPAEGDGRADGG
jgi:hypothetical protein